MYCTVSVISRGSIVRSRGGRFVLWARKLGLGLIRGMGCGEVFFWVSGNNEDEEGLKGLGILDDLEVGSTCCCFYCFGAKNLVMNIVIGVGRGIRGLVMGERFTEDIG